MPEVSVIIPTYNRAHVLRRALESVGRQTFRDFEVIVADDASTDDTEVLVRSFDDARIRYIKSEKNSGPAVARNLGMAAARGKYIAFLDSDDEWLPDKLALQIARLDAEPSEVAVCFCGATIIKDGDTSNPVAYAPKKEWEEDTYRKFVRGEIFFLTPTILIRTSCLEKAGMMTPSMRRCEDIEFLLRIFRDFRLAVVSEQCIVCHLVVSPRVKKSYEELAESMPFLLRHQGEIENRLGSREAAFFVAQHRLSVLCAAVRERRWRDSVRELWVRITRLPFLSLRDLFRIVRAFGRSMIG